MAIIELTPEAELLKFPVRTDKFVIYKRNGKYILSIKAGADFSNPHELIDSVDRVLHERITKMNSR